MQRRGGNWCTGDDKSLSLALLDSSNNLWPVRNQSINYIRSRSAVNNLVLQAKLLNTILGITIHFVLRSTRPDQAFFGVTNDNLTFDNIVKLYHQYQHNWLYGKGVYLAHKEGNLYPLGFKIHFLLKFYCLFTLHVTLDITIPLVLPVVYIHQVLQLIHPTAWQVSYKPPHFTVQASYKRAGVRASAHRFGQAS